MSVEENALLSADAQRAIQHDVLEEGGYWAEAAHVPVDWDEDFWPLQKGGRSGKPPKGVQMSGLDFDPETMVLIEARRAVLYDAESRLPIALYACQGSPGVGAALRSHLGPLGEMPLRRKFNLSREREAFKTEEGGVQQRMEMVGGHMCGRNGSDGKRPTHSRPGLSAHVVNADGDLCLYVNGWDEHAYWYAPGMMRMYADMAEIIKSAMPSGSVHTAALQGTVDTARRCFTDVGFYLEPSRVLGECIGFSSEYEASIHNDPTDMGFTTAFIGKCGHTEPCGCDVRGCAAALFEPVRNAWRKGALSGCGECALAAA